MNVVYHSKSSLWSFSLKILQCRHSISTSKNIVLCWIWTKVHFNSIQITAFPLHNHLKPILFPYKTHFVFHTQLLLKSSKLYYYTIVNILENSILSIYYHSLINLEYRSSKSKFKISYYATINKIKYKNIYYHNFSYKI